MNAPTVTATSPIAVRRRTRPIASRAGGRPSGQGLEELAAKMQAKQHRAHEKVARQHRHSEPQGEFHYHEKST